MVLSLIQYESAVPFFVGLLLGVVAAGLSAWLYSRLRRRNSVAWLLQQHLGNTTDNSLEIHSREFPYRVCVDANRSIQEWIENDCQTVATYGVPVTSSFMESIGISSLMSPMEESAKPCAIEYDAVDVGETEAQNCPKHALWLLRREEENLALLWTSTTTHSGCGFETKLRIDLAVRRRDSHQSASESFFQRIEKGIQEAHCFRGKVLSLESNSDYRGTSGGILVHRLRSVAQEDVILPKETVRLIERNVVRFVQQRPELAKHGMPLKKGLLFYGPPGTGKTHTLHYLFGSLPDHTVLLITGEQVGLLQEYIALARLLQPSVVVIEDADLVGRERDGMAVGRESLLNRLLNEMDGLRSDAEILFLLTTNRPEALEKALAARPGRIDQAVEFPLPNELGRSKLIRLYAAGASITQDVVDHTARLTEGVSAAFIKELMRRAIQFHLECRSTDGQISILQNDIDQAIEELMYAGGSLNRTLLGADSSEFDDPE